MSLYPYVPSQRAIYEMALARSDTAAANEGEDEEVKENRQGGLGGGNENEDVFGEQDDEEEHLEGMGEEGEEHMGEDRTEGEVEEYEEEGEEEEELRPSDLD